MTVAPGAAPDVRVSVLITTYNHERFVGQALDSVLEQRGAEPWEILVGDDCSTDGTRAVLDRYARKYPELISLVYPRENMGGGGKPNFAELVRRSRGRYVAVLDGDDYWISRDKLRRQVEHLDEHPECSMVFHNAVCRPEGGTRPDFHHNPLEQPSVLPLAQLFDHNPVAACSPVFRREVLDPLPEWYFRLPWGDWPLYFLAAERGELNYLPDVMGVWRIHENGMYSGISRLTRLELEAEFFEGLAGALTDAEDLHRRRRLATTLTKCARAQMAAGDRAAARRSLARSFRAWPVDPRRLRPGGGELKRLQLWLSLHVPWPARFGRPLGARKRPVPEP